MLSGRLQKSSGAKAEIGVLNEGIIGNRLLHDSPKGAGNPFGVGLGQAGLARFDRDVLAQAGVRYVIVGLGINDILFPAFPFTPPSEKVNAEDIISGYRQLIARAHRKDIRVIGTTNPPFECVVLEARQFRVVYSCSEPVPFTLTPPPVFWDETSPSNRVSATIH